MKDKIYKYGFYTLVVPFVLFLGYCTIYGAIDRAYAFAQSLNGGMSPHDAKCAMAFGQDMEIE